MLLEKAFALVKTLWDGGPAALWEQIKEFIGDLKKQVVDAIQNWVITAIVKAAITKLVSMFNPVGAIIQAILTIYNTVMFFIVVAVIAVMAIVLGAEQGPKHGTHAEEVGILPLHHPDPFDRMLVAQARVEGLTLVTHDRRLEPYKIRIVWT